MSTLSLRSKTVSTWLGASAVFSCLSVAAVDAPTCPTRGVAGEISLGESKTVHDWTGGRDGRRVFRLNLNRANGIRAFTTGTTEMDGSLFSAGNKDLVALDSPAHGENFRISAFLPSGSYCIRAETADGGTYDLHVLADAEDFDDDRNTVRHAKRVVVRPGRQRHVEGMIEGVGDVDYFRFTTDEEGVLTTHSEGAVDLMASLVVSDASGWSQVTSDRDSGTSYNFMLDTLVHPDGVYYLVVTPEGGEIGPYRVVMSFDPVGATGDTMADATRVVVGSVVGGRIESEDDRDFYAIDGIEGAAGGLRILSLGSTDIRGALLTADGTVVAEDDDGGEGLNFDIREDVSGIHYVRVESAGGATGDYELVLSRQPLPMDEGESIADAVALPVDAPVEASFDGSARDRTDVFKIEGPQRVRIETEGPLDVAAVLTTPDGLVVAGDDDSGTDMNFRFRPDLRGDTHYLHVVNLAIEGGGAYRVSVAPDETEPPDDDRDLALPDLAPVEFGSRTVGTIEPAGDVDYYRLAAAEPTLVRVYTEGETDTVGDLLRGGVSVRDPNYAGSPFEMIWAPLASNDDGGNQTNFLITQGLDGGDYFIRVGGLGSETGDYVLGVDRLEDDHGGSPKSATVVSAETASVAGEIDPASDIDYFWIPSGTTEGRRLVVTTTGELDTLGTLEDEHGAVLSEDDDAGQDGNFLLEQEVVGSGVYVRVESYGSRTGTYVLLVDRFESDDD